MSRCLLGDRVRYDAEVRLYPQLVQFIQQQFDYISVCPEVEIGLTVPRPPVQLSGKLSSVKITGRDDPTIDISDDMLAYCQQRPAQLNSIQGYIFKSKSPSCGIRDIPLFNHRGAVTEMTRGVFVSAMLQHYPNLPITDEQALQNKDQQQLFLQLVKQYQRASS